MRLLLGNQFPYSHGVVSGGIIFKSASLDLNFAKNKSLVDSKTGRNLVTFTRASSGTYVGSDGLIKTATTNLLLRSEEFDTTWSASDASVSTNQTIAPDGNTTADKLVCGTGTPLFQGITQSTTAIASAARFSVYVKAAELDQIELRSFSPTDWAVFELSTQQVLSQSGSPDATITDAGNGWHRCSIASSSSGATSFRISLASGGSRTFTPISGAGVYLWGAQLEQSDTVGEYVPTTSTINSAPRFDHDPTTGESLGLLVEESRTNLLLKSENFVTWSGFRKSVTSDQALSPAGLLNADLAAAIESNSSGAAISNQFTPSTTTYTFSVFAKANTTSALLLRPQNTGTFPEAAEAYFNLSTGQNGGVSDDGLVFTNSSQQIKDCGNGWYKCSVTFTLASASFTANVRIYIIDSVGSLSVTSGASFYVWGAQLEEGSFPTSYIPTEGSTVTRAADVASITGSNFSSWYRQDEGTLFGDAQTPFAVTGFPIIADGRVSTTDIVQIGFVTEARSVGYVKAGNVDQAVIYNPGLTGNRRRRIAFGMKADNFSVSTNGSALVSDASGNMPTNIADLYIGSRTGTNFLNGTIRRLTYWPQRLSDPILQKVTR